MVFVLWYAAVFGTFFRTEEAKLAQIFPEWSNQAPRFAMAGLAIAGLLAAGGVWYFFSPEYTDVGYQPNQPIPFSHLQHAGEMELDCRYCHAQVERSAVATVPPSQVCMNCHLLVGRDRESLQPLYSSFDLDLPIAWVRVHKVPDYAHFDHGAHVRAGVGCSDCHGDIRTMEKVTLMKPLSMSWCLDCHRNPALHIRPAEEITNTTWTPPPDQMEFARRVMQEKNIQPPTDCSACHR
jgi:hypothetical protein